MMLHQEYHWKSFDGLDIFGQAWQPSESRPRAIINLIHGLGEHSGRYHEWAGWFVEEGYAVLSMDYRGHGKSGGRRGHTDEYLSLIRDVGLLLSKSEELFPGQPIILYGHSIGGNLVINYVIRFNPHILALIATSPLLKLAFEPSRMKLFFANMMKSLFPSMLNSTGLIADHLSHDAEVVKKYQADPLVHNKISITAYFAVMRAGLEAIRDVGRINVPFLLMHGSADMIASCKASQELVHNKNNKLTFRLWNDGYHELHNELVKKDVFRFIVNWLNELQNESRAKENMHGYF